MRESEEIDLRDGLVYDPAVKGYDSNFWHGDTANLLTDTVKGAIKVGDTGLVGSASSYSQYLFGDFEFDMLMDSLSPDSNDSEKYFGLRNIGDSNRRGAIYFDLSYDTTAGDSSPSTRPFSCVAIDEDGNEQRKNVTWDTLWGGNGITARFRIKWEQDQVQFLVNDSVVATMGDQPRGKTAVYRINNNIPQALRMSSRSLDAIDTSALTLKLLAIRHARKVI